MTKPAVLFAVGTWDPAPWVEAVMASDPQRPVFVWPDVPAPEEIAYALAWKPPTGVFADLPRLKAILSLGAGVDHLILRDDLPDVPIARVVDPDLTERMTEWVVLQVLMHHRRQRLYDAQQRAMVWKERRQAAAHEVCVGIMGMGVLGRAAAKALGSLGFRVAGWSRSPSRQAAELAGIETFAGNGALDAFLARTDILVSLLPLTDATRGILSAQLFQSLSRSRLPGLPVLINAGRGGLQVEADIIAALESGVLAGASLDVFETEPLDPASPLWGMDTVVITPHAAAASAPAALVPGLLRQIADFEAGTPFKNLVNRKAGY
jgi:glyoxylate/hydroxypyruvate reductase A